MSFVKRRLDFTFVLGLGSFGETAGNAVKLTGLRASVQTSNAGGPSTVSASMKVFGVPLSIINRLTTLGYIATTNRRNSVLVEAGDEGGFMSTVFTGTINNSWGDFNSQPDVALMVDAQSGFIESIEPSPSISYKGGADVATILATLAARMGLRFENNGVSRSLHNPNYYGSPWIQARAIVRDAGIDWNSGENGILSIWNPGHFRNIPPITISAENGMIGYPTYSSTGLILRTLYNPVISQGQKFILKTTLKTEQSPVVSPQALGSNWGISALAHTLESEMPGGKWESEIWAAPPGYTMVPTGG